MSAFDHLSPDQFDPTNFNGWDGSPYRFSKARGRGKPVRNSPMEANALGHVESRDRVDDEDLDSMAARHYPFADDPGRQVYRFVPYTAQSYPN